MTFHESMFQKSCIRWFRMNYPKQVKMLFAIPNGAHLGGKTAVARAKNWNRLEAEGCVPGVADLFLMVQPGLFIEMKFEKGKQSETQIEFQKTCEETGYGYLIVNDYEQFKQCIVRRLGAPKLDMIAKGRYYYAAGQ